MNDLLFLSTIKSKLDSDSLNPQNSGSSKLIIYSLEHNEILKMWEGIGMKNYFVSGNLLIFDDGFGKDSFIIIYNLETRKTFAEIKIKDGCGLRNIPKIPDYGG
jgi:hypothetical protein